jgi:hypothetical protein
MATAAVTPASTLTRVAGTDDGTANRDVRESRRFLETKDRSDCHPGLVSQTGSNWTSSQMTDRLNRRSHRLIFDEVRAYDEAAVVGGVPVLDEYLARPPVHR